jgi:hypothetical protein
MRMSVPLFSLLLLSSFLGAIAWTSSAQAQSPLFDEVGRNFRGRQWEFALQTNYFQATANYTPGGGQYTSLVSGSSYNLMTFDFGTRWIPVNRWGIYASTQVGNAESKDLIDTRRNSTFTQAVVGSDYLWISNKRWELYPDFALTFPIERVDANRDEVLNHEGALELATRFVGRARWGSFEPFAFLGYTYRDEDRASLLPYGVGAEFQFSSWALGGELRGYQSATRDRSSVTNVQRAAMAARNGGALKFNSTDPALMETNFWLKGSLMEAVDFKLGGGTSITGTNMAAGWNVFVALSYAFAEAPSGRTYSPPKRGRSHQEDAERFEEEINDGVNQNLFSPTTAGEMAKEKAEEKKKLQNEMDQTEFQIELKSAKKKRKSVP